MPTQEERLAALEQTTAEHIKETARHIRQTNEHLTMTLGLIQRQSFDISAINHNLEDMQESIQNTLSVHFEGANAHLEHLQLNDEKTDKRLNAIETQLTQHTTLFNEHKTLLTQHTTLLNEHKTLLTQILARLSEKP
jgi:pyruvate-formate lyase-activating enzyme